MNVTNFESRLSFLEPGRSRMRPMIALVLMLEIVVILPACAHKGPNRKSTDFFTSGDREADQRASQRMAQAEQLSGEGSGERKRENSQATDSKNSGIRNPEKRALFDRLGGEPGLSNIVEDFVPRALQDPRVNWERKGMQSRGWFHRTPTVHWKATPESVAILKKHFIQFLALASGGPVHYEGKEMKGVHAGMRISNPEFDATIGDLKASLDKLEIPNAEQKELLAIVESVRPQIVTER